MNELQELEQLKARIASYSMDWRNRLDERERRLISNCVDYAYNDPAGLPGHNLMIIVSKLAAMLDQELPAEESKA